MGQVAAARVKRVYRRASDRIQQMIVYRPRQRSGPRGHPLTEVKGCNRDGPPVRPGYFCEAL